MASPSGRAGGRRDARHRSDAPCIGRSAAGATSCSPSSPSHAPGRGLRFARHPTRANAVLAGALSGGACLTRITTIALIAPAVIWLLATSNAALRTDGEYSARRRGADIRGKRRARGGRHGDLVAPFLINCAIATGDPFYAINNHTDFYLKREGVADVRPIQRRQTTRSTNSNRGRSPPPTTPCAAFSCIRSAING